MAVGERLQYARQRSSMTLQQVSERTGIGLSSLSEFENGKRNPSMAQVTTLASMYGKSMAFFFGEEQILEEVILWRQEPDPGQSAEIERKFLSLCEQYHNLEAWCDKQTTCKLPSPAKKAAEFRFAEAEALATEVRRGLSLGDIPAPILLRVLEEGCGLKVFHFAFEPHGSAACTVSPTFGKAVLLNTNHARWRRNFDLAHELFHILTWSVFRTAPTGRKPAPLEEQLANHFASNLLIPNDAFKAALARIARKDSVNLHGLRHVAREFDVSMHALLVRTNAVFGQPPKEAIPSLVEQNKELGPIHRRGPKLLPERPARFRALAYEAVAKGECSLGKFAEYMGISREEAEKQIETLGPGHGEEISIAPA